MGAGGTQYRGASLEAGAIDLNNRGEGWVRASEDVQGPLALPGAFTFTYKMLFS